LIIKLNSKLLTDFFNNVSSLVSDTFTLKHNLYIFSKVSSLNHIWRFNFSKLIFKTKPKKFKKLLSYYFFKNKIHVVMTINFNMLKLLKVLKTLKLIKIGFLVSQSRFEFYQNFLYLPTYNFFTQYYIYTFIMRIYILNINIAYKSLNAYFNNNFKLFTFLNIN
jgi:hypothetical protein